MMRLRNPSPRAFFSLALLFGFVLSYSQPAAMYRFSKEDREWTAQLTAHSLTNPGIKFSMDRPFASKLKFKARPAQNKSKKIQKELMFNSQLGFFWDPLSNSLIYNHFQIAKRKTNNNSFKTTWRIGPGWARSFTPNTYSYNGPGDVSKRFLAGAFYLSSNVGVDFKKLTPKRKYFKYITWGLDITAMHGMNSNPLVPFYNVGLGVTLRNESIKKQKY